MLCILLATCETTLDRLRAADDAVDVEFVADLERITERTRREVETLGAEIAIPSEPRIGRN